MSNPSVPMTGFCMALPDSVLLYHTSCSTEHTEDFHARPGRPSFPESLDIFHTIGFP